MSKKHPPFYILTLAIFLGIISPFWLADGMFTDGTSYATVANNLANDIGGIWDMFFTETLYPHFHEHPPLAMALQSIFFRLFGDSIYIERLYSVGTFAITAFIINKIWKLITPQEHKQLAWLPLLFTALIPLITWSATNNMLENTMMIFTLLATLFIIKSTESHRIINIKLAGFMLALGVLSKGLVALYPLSLLFWILIFKRNISIKQFFTDTVILTIGLVIPFILLFLFVPESYDSLLAYFNKQVVGSIQNVQTVDSRFWILVKLISEHITIGVIILLIYVFTRKSKVGKSNNGWAYAIIALAFSGVLPIMISMKQSGFYILSTFPLFAIALSLLIAPRVLLLTNKIDIKSKGFKIFRTVSYSLLAISILLVGMQIGKYGRDKDRLEDIYSIIEVVPKGSTISIANYIYGEWSIHAYFYRYANISLETKMPYEQQFLLFRTNSKNEIPANYIKQDMGLKEFILLKRK